MLIRNVFIQPHTQKPGWREHGVKRIYRSRPLKAPDRSQITRRRSSSPYTAVLHEAGRLACTRGPCGGFAGRTCRGGTTRGPGRGRFGSARRRGRRRASSRPRRCGPGLHCCRARARPRRPDARCGSDARASTLFGPGWGRQDSITFRLPYRTLVRVQPTGLTTWNQTSRCSISEFWRL